MSIRLAIISVIVFESHSPFQQLPVYFTYLFFDIAKLFLGIFSIPQVQIFYRQGMFPSTSRLSCSLLHSAISLYPNDISHSRPCTPYSCTWFKNLKCLYELSFPGVTPSSFASCLNDGPCVLIYGNSSVHILQHPLPLHRIYAAVFLPFFDFLIQQLLQRLKNHLLQYTPYQPQLLAKLQQHLIHQD